MKERIVRNEFATQDCGIYAEAAHISATIVTRMFATNGFSFKAMSSAYRQLRY